MALNALFESRRSYGLISVAGRMGPTVEGEHAADRSGGVGLRILKGSRSPRGKWSGQRWDESDHALRLARRKLNHDLGDLPVPGNKAESCRDRFGHAMLCGPIGPDAIESDTVKDWRWRALSRSGLPWHPQICARA